MKPKKEWSGCHHIQAYYTDKKGRTIKIGSFDTQKQAHKATLAYIKAAKKGE